MRLSTYIILLMVVIGVGIALVCAGQEIKGRDTARQARIAELCND